MRESNSAQDLWHYNRINKCQRTTPPIVYSIITHLSLIHTRKLDCAIVAEPLTLAAALPYVGVVCLSRKRSTQNLVLELIVLCPYTHGTVFHVHPSEIGIFFYVFDDFGRHVRMKELTLMYLCETVLCVSFYLVQLLLSA